MQKPYVYIYLDPRHHGIFQTNLISFLYQPFYVGKGTGNRWDFNERLLITSNYFLKTKLKELKANELKPLVMLIECETENDAFSLEFQLTSFLGIYPNNGMCNLRYGGLGGFTLSEYTKSLLSQLNSRENNPNYGKTWTEERRKKHQKTWDKKRASGEAKKSDVEMERLWAPTRRKYIIVSTSGKVYETDNLTTFCESKGWPLSAFRKALKSENKTVQSKMSLKKRTSAVEGFKIDYVNI